MSGLVKLNGELITSDFVIRYLRFNDEFDEILDKILSDKITVHIARQQNVTVGDDELQERIDQLRRVQGLHRAKDTQEYIESLGFTVDEFGEYIRDEILKAKMLDLVCSDDNVEEYFKLNSPQFDTVELCHILVSSEGKARELIAVLEDDLDSFGEMAAEHSLASDTAKTGGSLGSVMRGVLADEIEAKVFNADTGAIIGPYESGDELTYEIFKIEARHDAELNAKTAESIKNILRRDWIKTRLSEYQLEFV